MIGPPEDEMCSRRILTVDPDNDPLWVRLYVHDIDGVWAAMLVAAAQAPPEPSTLKGPGFLGDTREEAEDATDPERSSLERLALIRDRARRMREIRGTRRARLASGRKLP